LWDTENGPLYGDEINLVLPGFNSGWSKVQGIWKPNGDKMGKILLEPSSVLVNFNGKGYYSLPEFIWKQSVGPSAIKFLKSKIYGTKYENDLFVGDVDLGNLYNFELNEDRTSLKIQRKSLEDKIADNHDELDDSIIFAKNFEKITDIEISPDGYLYILSSYKETNLYKIIPL
jgi:glucose/arabinose dehydrogenase